MMNSVRLSAVQTPIFHPGDDLAQFVIQNVQREMIQEKMILAVTSKIVSLAEQRLVPKSETDKPSLVRREADVFLGEAAYGCFLTVKDGLFIPSAGIDESNSETGDYIIYPADPYRSAHDLWSKLREHWKLRDLGIILTDSHTSPLRRGVTGICLSHWGFRAVRDMVGTQDLFGRHLQMTKMNYADALSSMTVMVMGEGRESCPLAIVTGVDVEFCTDTDPAELRMPLEEDLYYPVLAQWADRRK